MTLEELEANIRKHSEIRVAFTHSEEVEGIPPNVHELDKEVLILAWKNSEDMLQRTLMMFNDLLNRGKIEL